MNISTDKVNLYYQDSQNGGCSSDLVHFTNLNLSQFALKGNTFQGNLSYTSHNPPAPALVSSPYSRQQDSIDSQENPQPLCQLSRFLTAASNAL